MLHLLLQFKPTFLFSGFPVKRNRPKGCRKDEENSKASYPK
ncbi:hypothetical protein B4135_2727 [Caldibacillus debilis]|uniref:Uncharacterized protein n=1 Tax=Caldibacillus debilis TaxID=301148 RepID=A0A150LT32_9BACI|nr:hypothetical protein B4135_2727 [Caldibacillus debilis]